MRIDPGAAPRAQVEAQDFVAEIAEVGGIPDHRGRRSRIADARNSQNFPAVADANAVENFVAAGDVCDAVCDRRSAVNVVFGLETPESPAVARVEAIERSIVRADQDAVADYHRRRFDLSAGLVRPD